MAEVFPAERLRGRFNGINLDDLVDWRVVRTWLYWGMFWLLVMPTVGVTISGLFNYPDYLGTNNLGLTFGRLRPVQGARVRFGGRNARTDRRGRATMVKRFGASRRDRRYTARAFRRDLRTGRVVVRVRAWRRR